MASEENVVIGVRYRRRTSEEEDGTYVTTTQERSVLTRLYLNNQYLHCIYVNKHVFFLNRVLSFGNNQLFRIIVFYYILTRLDYSSALEYSIIRHYTNIGYY